MTTKTILFATAAFLMLSSCLSSKVTGVEYRREANYTGKHGAYEKTSFFPFKMEQPFTETAKDELVFSAFLVLADSNWKVELKGVQPYLIKNSDTIVLKEVKKMERFSYPGLLKEPELYIHFDYTVIKTSDGSKQEIKEDHKLYRYTYSFRTVH